MFSRGWAVKALSFVGLQGSNTLLKSGPGDGKLGPVPTLLTSMYTIAAARQVRICQQIAVAIIYSKTTSFTG